MKYWNILLLTTILSNMVGLVYAQTSYTWNGATDTDFATSTNWTPNGVPGSGDNITIVTGSNTCKLDGNRTVNNLTMTSGTLDLETYDITVDGSADFNGGVMEDGLLKMTQGSIDFDGTAVRCEVDVDTDVNGIDNTTFEEKVTLKTSGNFNGGGNVFKDTTVITINATSYTNFGLNSPDTFLAPVTFNLETGGLLRVIHNADGGYFADDVTLNNHSGSGAGGIIVGNHVNADTRFDGDIIMNVDSTSGFISFSLGVNQHDGQLLIGSEGYHSGVLTISAYEQVGTDAIDLSSMDHNATLSLGNDLTLEGDLTCAAVTTTIGTGCYFKGQTVFPKLTTWNGATFDGKATITTASGLNTGGNVFKDTTAIVVNGTGYTNFGYNSPDTFLAPVTFDLESSGTLRVIHNGDGGYFADDVTLNNHSGSVSGSIIVGNHVNADTRFDGDIIMNVDSTSGHITFSQGVNEHNGQLLIGSEGYHSGTFTLKAYTPVDTFDLDLSSMDHNAKVVFNGVALLGNLICPDLNTTVNTECDFSGSVYIPNLTTWEASKFRARAELILANNLNTGGNFFADSAIITIEGTGYTNLGYNSPDTFRAPVTFNLEENGILRVIHNGDGGYFANDVTLNNHSGSGAGAIIVGNHIDSDTRFDGDIFVNVDSTSGYISFHLGENLHNGLLKVGEEGVHHGTLTLDAYEQTALGTIDLTSFTNGAALHVKSDADITASLDFAGGGNATLDGATFRGSVNIEGSSLAVTDCVFHGTTTLKKTGGTNNLNGGNKYLGDATIANSSATNYVYWGHSEPDTFLYDLTLSNTTTSQSLIMAYSTASVFEGNIALEGDTGNVIQFGRSTAGNKAVLAGDDSQTISVENEIDGRFYRLDVSKNGGQVSLVDSISIYTEIELSDGVVKCISDGQVTLIDNASVVGGSDTSHIEGYVTKIGNDAFTFPVGEKGVYKPITMTAPGSVSDEIEMRYERWNPNYSYGEGILDTNLRYVTPKDYWSIDQKTGTSDMTWTIGWRGEDGYSRFDSSQVVVSGWSSNGGWFNLGGTAQTGNEASGEVTTSITVELDSIVALAFGSISDSILPQGLYARNISLTKAATSDTALGYVDLAVSGGVSPVRVMVDSVVYSTYEEAIDFMFQDTNLAIIFLDSLVLRDSVHIDTIADRISGHHIAELGSGFYDIKVFDANNDTVSLQVPIDFGYAEVDSVGVTVNAGVITKDAATGWSSGYFKLYAVVDSLADTEARFQVVSTDSLLVVGFMEADTAAITGFEHFEYAFVVDSGEVDIWAADTLLQKNTTISPSDELKIQRRNGTVSFLKNGTLLHTESQVAPKIIRPVFAGHETGGGIDGFEAVMAVKDKLHGVMKLPEIRSTDCDENAGYIKVYLSFADHYSYKLYRSGVLQPDVPVFLGNSNYVYAYRYDNLESGFYEIECTAPNGNVYTFGYNVGASPTWQNTNAVLTTGGDIHSVLGSYNTNAPNWEASATTENFIPSSDEGWAKFEVPVCASPSCFQIPGPVQFVAGFTEYQEVMTPLDFQFAIIFYRSPYTVGLNCVVVDNGTYQSVWTPQSYAYLGSDTDFKISKTKTTGDNVVFKIHRNGLLIYTTIEREDVNKYHFGFAAASNTALLEDVHLSFGCSAEVDFDICNDDLTRNWVERFGYTDDGEVIAHSKAYYDDFGKATQTQTRMFADDDVIAAETVYDQFGRPVLSTLPAPINQTQICYEPEFITNESDEHYSYEDFNIPNYTTSSSSITMGEVDYPAPVGDNISNTLGWYYSNSNNNEPYVPASGYPYTRVEFDDRNPDRVRRSVMAGEYLEMGSGHEQILNVVPIMEGELWHYLAIDHYFTDNQVSSLAYEGTKHISTDPNGVESLSYYDKSGNLLATCSDWRYSNSGSVIYSTEIGLSTTLQVDGSETLDKISVYGIGNVKLVQGSNDSVIYQGPKSGVTTALFDTSETYTFTAPSDFTLEYTIISPTDTTDVLYEASRDADTYQSEPSFVDVHIPDSAVSSLEFAFPKQRIDVINMKNGDSIYSGIAEDLNLTDGGVYRFIADSVFLYEIPADSVADLYIECSQDFAIYYKDTLVYDGPTKTWATGLPKRSEGLHYELRSGAECYVEYENTSSSLVTILDWLVNLFNMFLEYEDREHDCAYYYYDNADNLVATVPPKGVIPPFTTIPPMYSTYKYDSRGLTIENKHPDEGRSRFVYDEEGKLRFSQNALQYAEDAGGNYPNTTMRFNYIEYDDDSRIVETGEYDPTKISGSSIFFENQFTYTTSHPSTNKSVHSVIDGTNSLDEGRRRERSYIIYDEPDPDFDTETGLTAYDQKNILGRVSKTWNANSATWYSYDERGRLDWTVRHIPAMDEVGINDDGLFTMHYSYNAQGNVDKIEFNKDETSETFTHWMTYDADGRLLTVETGRDEYDREEIVAYDYYLHGPLKRIELGNNLQGVDYVYTINGWLKSVNNPELGNRDPGGDDGTGGTAPTDIFGMTLDYFIGDYQRENTYVQTYNNPSLVLPQTPDYKPKALYNGNIMAQRWKHASVSGFEYNNEQLFYGYLYDKQNQLRSARLGRVLTVGNQNYDPLNPPGTTTGYIGPVPTLVNAYRVLIEDYDPNGNILELSRNGNASTGLNMDDLNYVYHSLGNNKLKRVEDAATTSTYSVDIQHGQTGTNYVYNAIGQMTSDASEGVYYAYSASGLITGVYEDAAHTEPVATYTYDDAGQRLKKTSYSGSPNYYKTLDTWYVRNDAGQLTSIYEETYVNNAEQNDMAQEEIPLYASNRVGIWDVDGYRTFELTDHLGNVRATFFDNSGLNVSTVQDYYPFGWGMPGRLSIGGFVYRFGYQGQFAEKDNETGLTNFELRSMDTRLGRWMIADPERQYHSPYLAMGNNSINLVDPDGAFAGPNDWVYNHESGEYEWHNAVTSAENTPLGYQYIGESLSDVYSHFQSTSSMFNFFDKPQINFSNWGGEAFVTNKGDMELLKDWLDGNVPFPLSLGSDYVYSTVEDLHVVFIQSGKVRTDFSGNNISGRVLQDKGVMLVAGFVLGRSTALSQMKIRGLNTAEFSSLLKGTKLNKFLYSAGSQVRGYTNRFYNWVNQKQVPWIVGGVNTAAPALENQINQ